MIREPDAAVCAWPRFPGVLHGRDAPVSRPVRQTSRPPRRVLRTYGAAGAAATPPPPPRSPRTSGFCTRVQTAAIARRPPASLLCHTQTSRLAWRDYGSLGQRQRRDAAAGPVIISPHGIIPSLYREMILKRPEEFKMAALQGIRSLFPDDWNPFYCGFGNRGSDDISYLHVGVPPHRIFTINPAGAPLPLIALTPAHAPACCCHMLAVRWAPNHRTGA